MKHTQWILGAVLVTALLMGAGASAQINVSTWAELQAAAPAPGTTVQFAAGTFTIPAQGDQVNLRDGVTYLGDPGGGTIIDGGGAARAFTAWRTGRDQDPQTGTAPTGWVLDSLTIQNCSSDGNSRDATDAVTLAATANRDNDGGALNIEAGGQGTIQNCTFINCFTPATHADRANGGDDGGAIDVSGTGQTSPSSTPSSMAVKHAA